MWHMDPLVHISSSDLQDYAAALLEAGGFSAEDSIMIARSLVSSNLAGHDSHGVSKLIGYIDDLRKGDVVSGAAFSIVQETASSCVADGGKGQGQVMMPRFLDVLYGKVGDTGVVSGAMRHCGHVGRLGEWVEQIAAHGYAGFVAVNDNGFYRFVAPPGMTQACTSTNPIAFSVPVRDGAPFILDMSTSAVAMGKVRLAYNAGQDCSAGALQDAEGQPTRDPAALCEGDVRGSILPMGGDQWFKGFGLSMVVDFLTAGLSGGFTPPAPDGAPGFNNVLAVIWDPQRFSGLEHLQQQAQKYMDYIAAIPVRGQEGPVRIPGARAQETKQNRQADGIPLDRSVVERLQACGVDLGVALPAAFEM